MALDLTLESLAAVSLFVVNAAVVIVAVGTYWRMTRYEQSNHIYIVNALREVRDSGREMKIAAHELMRVAERGGISRHAGPVDVDLKGLEELPDLIRKLLDSYGIDADDDDPDADEESRPEWPETPAGMSPELLEQLKRSHRNEVDRLLAQRRRMQMELGRTRERLDENTRLLNTFRARTGQNMNSQADLQAAKQRLENANAQLQQLRDKLELSESRAATAERAAARLQRDLEELAIAPHGGGAMERSEEGASRAELKQLKTENADLRDRLANADRQLEKLRADLEVLSADPPESHGPTETASEELQRELEQLKSRYEDLQDTLKRSLVEKDFIEDRFLAETQKNKAVAA
ncbi:hypothetical protein RQP53_08400 [Paucibacter sp. APW11]|uniref:Chromosome partition protein Smc n=1 Tax=Roseateles aquae TaxID=3077235 RepID=A0ABU3P9M3_9BURK|nr:hypothetical protein [Paucibacter sp. APW11]MDT8999282.1 hypothetical protein [Paucibacter sp. APW11]